MQACRMGNDCRDKTEIADEENICEDCARTAGWEIGDLPGDYFDLSNNLVPRTTPSDGMPPPPNPAESSPPLDLSVDELMRAIVWASALWEIPLREHLALPPAPDGPTGIRPGYLTSRACLLLAGRVVDLAALPPMWSYIDGVDAEPVLADGVAAIRTLRSLHRRARQKLGVTGFAIRLPGICPAPSCGAADLRRSSGSDEVHCGACARRWPWTEYRRYVALVGSGELLPQPAPTTRNLRGASPVRGA